MKRKFTNRKAVAAVEAAVCLPVLLVVWFGSFELSRMLSLKQQVQLLASNAAHEVIVGVDTFEEIETEVEALATSLGIDGADVTVTRLDSEIVSSTVTVDFGQNSPLSSVLAGRQVSSTFQAFRQE